MSANNKYKMENEYSWFIIEILAFYGYILSAVLVIIRNTIVSSCCGLKKHPEEYKGDFIAKQRDNLDWAAFISILFTVNVALISIDFYIYDECDEKLFPLRNIMYLLLFNHLLQMIFHLFLKTFFRHDGALNLNHQWVWFVLLASYMYVIYSYFCTKIVKNDVSQSHKMWIPLDILLTFGIATYQAIHYCKHRCSEKKDGEEDEESLEEVLIDKSE
jgi:hypothetical protein